MKRAVVAALASTVPVASTVAQTCCADDLARRAIERSAVEAATSCAVGGQRSDVPH
jgi:hypothetical protein